jgi:hypothetical protein
MFLYTDPAGTLSPQQALDNYRIALETEYQTSARLKDSAFALLEAFDGIPKARLTFGSVSWPAFPRKTSAPNGQIDQERFTLQDEYVEWRVERTNNRIHRVTFTTEFLAYYVALARTSTAALLAAIQTVIPGAKPTNAELFGPGVTASPSALERARRFTAFAQRNPWINGNKGILCLAHSNNSLLALFRLVDIAAVRNPVVEPADVCSSLDGFCDPARNSDPNIAAAVQQIARDDHSFSLVDPVGIEIAALGGIWRRGNRTININDPAANEGLWNLTRGKRRGELTIPDDLLSDDQPITSGAQVAATLRVQASVIAARNVDLPEWARIGNEEQARGGGH